MTRGGGGGGGSEVEVGCEAENSRSFATRRRVGVACWMARSEVSDQAEPARSYLIAGSVGRVMYSSVLFTKWDDGSEVTPRWEMDG